MTGLDWENWDSWVGYWVFWRAKDGRDVVSQQEQPTIVGCWLFEEAAATWLLLLPFGYCALGAFPPGCICMPCGEVIKGVDFPLFIELPAPFYSFSFPVARL